MARTLLAPIPLMPGETVIEGPEAHHGRNVLRLAIGETLRLCDGQGRSGEGVVVAVDRHCLRCRLAAVVEAPLLPAEFLSVALAPPKGARMELVLRALTELGVGAIHFLKTRRGGVPPAPDRARRICVEALKQCGRCRLPELFPVSDIASLHDPRQCLIMLVPDGPPARPGPPRPTMLVIGPEGGFEADEVMCLERAGALPARLAKSVLRIETAAVAAAAVWIAAWEGQ